jgi:ectoine hydroxylase-related dioxygenase (phytanoyl-CoA dioxygenase family)
MPNFLRTYDELVELINFSNALLINYCRNDFKDFSNDEILYLIGCKFFEVDVYYPISHFQSNRYFLDSIGMSLLPNLKRIKELEEYVLSNPDFGNLVEEIYQKAFNSAELNNYTFDDNDFDLYLKNGYLVIEDIIDSETCDKLIELVNFHIAKERASNKGGYIYGDGNMQRIYNLVTKDFDFRRLLEHPIIHGVMRKIFHRENFHSKYYLTSYHANVLGPEAKSQIWHIDANVPDPLPDWNIRVNVNFLVQDYTSKNGATEVIPGSHLWRRKPNHQEAIGNNSSGVAIEAPKGSVIIWHGYLWHRSGQNMSKNNRIALLSTYAAGFLREVSLEENVFLSSNSSIHDLFSENLKRILGWNHGLKKYGD